MRRDDDLTPDDCRRLAAAASLAAGLVEGRDRGRAAQMRVLAGRLLRHADEGGMHVLAVPAQIPEWINGGKPERPMRRWHDLLSYFREGGE